jgi:hypothetical protein
MSRLQQSRVQENTLDYKPDLSRATGAFASYLLNEGFSTSCVSSVVHEHFIHRTLNGPAIRELQDFFAKFPLVPKTFRVYVLVTDPLRRAVIEAGLAKASDQQFEGVVYQWKPRTNSRFRNLIEFEDIEARDFVSARYHCERALGAVRAIAYSAEPHLELEWWSKIIVQEAEEFHSTFEARDLMRQRPKVFRAKVLQLLKYEMKF